MLNFSYDSLVQGSGGLFLLYELPLKKCTHFKSGQKLLKKNYIATIAMVQFKSLSHSSVGSSKMFFGMGGITSARQTLAGTNFAKIT